MTPAEATHAVSDEIAEQLSAYMDGELPEAEARFLLRRLEHDPELRAAWARMQLASQCLRGQPWRQVEPGFADRVLAAVGPAPRQGMRRPLLGWAMAASVAALALLMAPRLLQRDVAPAPAIAEVPTPSVDHVVPTPGTADLVALRAGTASAESTDSADSALAVDQPLLAAREPSDRATPPPLSAEAGGSSPADFPLVDTGAARSWPRSEFVGSSNDPAIEAYLVRHNQMAADDGLGGFVPYVDVVANGRPAASDADGSEANEAAAGEGESQ